jgi:hypothetical protein
VIYDLAPPLARRGMKRDSVAAWLGSWEGPIHIRPHDVNLVVDGGLAFPQHSREYADARVVKSRTSGIGRRCVFGRRAGDGESVCDHSSVPSTWTATIARRWTSAVVAPRRALRVIWLIRARGVRQLLVQRLAVPQGTPEKLRACRYGRHRVRFLGQKAPDGRVMPT